MENIAKGIKIGVASTGTLLTWLFGTWDTALSVLAVFMVLDYASGVMKGFVTNTLSSDIGLKGLSRKFLIILILIGAVALDRLIGMDQWFFRTMVCYFYVANEGLSLLENAVALGLPVPDKLKDALAQLREGNKKGITNTNE